MPATPRSSSSLHTVKTLAYQQSLRVSDGGALRGRGWRGRGAGTALMDVLAQLGLDEDALALLADLRSAGVRLSARSYNAVLHTLAEEVRVPLADWRPIHVLSWRLSLLLSCSTSTVCVLSVPCQLDRGQAS